MISVWASLPNFGVDCFEDYHVLHHRLVLGGDQSSYLARGRRSESKHSPSTCVSYVAASSQRRRYGLRKGLRAAVTCSGPSSIRKWPIFGRITLVTLSATVRISVPTPPPTPCSPPTANTGILSLLFLRSAFWAMISSIAR